MGFTIYMSITLIKSILKHILAVSTTKTGQSNVQTAAKLVMLQLIALIVVMVLSMICQIISVFALSRTTVSGEIGSKIFLLISNSFLPFIAILIGLVLDGIIGLQTRRSSTRKSFVGEGVRRRTLSVNTPKNGVDSALDSSKRSNSISKH